MTLKDKMPVTAGTLERVLVDADKKLSKKHDDLTVEVVERLDAMNRLQDRLQELMVGVMGAVQMNNIAQPNAEDIDVQYLVDDRGFKQPTSRIEWERAKLRGETVYRQLVILERYQPDSDNVTQAQEVMAHARRPEVTQ